MMFVATMIGLDTHSAAMVKWCSCTKLRVRIKACRGCPPDKYESVTLMHKLQHKNTTVAFVLGPRSFDNFVTSGQGRIDNGCNLEVRRTVFVWA